MGAPLGNETAQGELEGLQTIYEDLIYEENGDKLSLTLLPIPGESFESDDTHVAFTIDFAFPKDYPTEQPEVNFRGEKGFNQVRRLTVKGIIDKLLDSHQGMEVVFDIYSELLTWIQENNKPVASMLEEITTQRKATDENVTKTQEVLSSDWDSSSDEESNSSESESDDGQAGRLEDKNLVAEEDRVTEEVFMRWRDAFKVEMIAAGTWRDIDARSEKLTGKEFFTSGHLSDKDKTDGKATDTQVFWGNEDVFAAEDLLQDDDVDLDDLDDLN